jgi:hypothetical protein
VAKGSGLVLSCRGKDHVGVLEHHGATHSREVFRPIEFAVACGDGARNLAAR